jgi:hypothetical protein
LAATEGGYATLFSSCSPIQSQWPILFRWPKNSVSFWSDIFRPAGAIKARCNDTMACYFSPEAQITLLEGRAAVQLKYRDLQTKYMSRKYKTDRGREYAHHGFCRRLDELARAIEFVFNLLPPGLDEIPESGDVVAATMLIQSFFLNASGCLDNLAWTWVFETGLRFKDGKELDPKSVGLGPANWFVRKSFSRPFRKHLNSRKRWFAHLDEFRDSAAHRIPLYIPPYIVSEADARKHAQLDAACIEAMRQGENEKYEQLRAEQKALGTFRPWMNHSLTEKSPTVVFHYQLLQDYETIHEFGQKILAELDLFERKSDGGSRSWWVSMTAKLRKCFVASRSLISRR